MDGSPLTTNAGPASATDARRLDPLGHDIHTALGALYLFSLPLTTAGSGITFALLLVFSVVRLRHTWSSYHILTRCPLLWMVLVWATWYGISIVWSANPAQGWDELRAARVLATPWMLWPVLDRVAVLIIAAIGGVVATNLIQAGQGLELFGLSPGENGRLTGLIHPTQAGIWCVAAMCWAVSGVLLGRGRLRWMSLVVLFAAGAGLIASGSRGPWLAGAVAVPLSVIVIAMRRPNARRVAIRLIAAGIIVTLVGGWFARGFIERRIDTAITELRDGWADEVYWTDGGLRIGLWRWAWDGFADSPIVGQGAGSFETLLQNNASYLEALEQQRELAPRFDMSRGHAHSVYLQMLCDLGLIGAAIGAAVLVLLLRNGWRDRLDHPFVDGNFFAILGWVAGAAFECYNLNGHTFGLLAALMAFTLPQRPPSAALPVTTQDSP